MKQYFLDYPYETLLSFYSLHIVRYNHHVFKKKNNTKRRERKKNTKIPSFLLYFIPHHYVCPSFLYNNIYRITQRRGIFQLFFFFLNSARIFQNIVFKAYELIQEEEEEDKNVRSYFLLFSSSSITFSC